MEHLSILALAFVLSLALCEGAPTTASLDDHQIAQEYLSNFYKNPDATESHARSGYNADFEKDLKAMQEFFGLEVTGKLDTNTRDAMKQPRCGVSDVARYAHFGGKPKLKKSIVTYRITEYTSRLNRSEVDATISKAFKLYSDVIPLDFKQIYNGTADITILFKAGYHGDFEPFDGPGNVLAHASSPGSFQRGMAHFDEDEEWTLRAKGINLLLVAAHEFGHNLGLSHSEKRSALMFPKYQYVNTMDYKLPEDDRLGVQALYGVRTNETALKPEPKPNPGPPPNACSPNLSFDAATKINGELHFFKNGYYWKKGHEGGLSLDKINSLWPSIHSVDAAYESEDKNITYLFKGEKYWAVTWREILPGYPKSITELGFGSDVKKIDAAVYVASIGQTLFFVGSKYWSFNERTAQMDPDFPKSIRQNIPNIGIKVHAAFEHDGYLYFSYGAWQREYDFSSRRVKRLLKNTEWMKCNPPKANPKK